METTNDVECLCFEFCLDSEKHPMGVQMICKPTARPPPSLYHCLSLDESTMVWNTSKFSMGADGAFDVERKAGDTVSNVGKQPDAPPQLITIHAVLSFGQSVQMAQASFSYIAPQGFMFGAIWISLLDM